MSNLKKMLSNFYAATTVVAKFLLLAFLLAGVCGCASSKEGITRHFIIGFGVVTVNNSQTNLAILQRTTALGIYGSTSPYSKIGLGYANFQTIEVVTNSNLLIEVDRSKITIPCTNH